MSYTVTVSDDETGEVIYMHTGLEPDADEVMDHATDTPMTPAEKALLLVAPQYCPWDCDSCHVDD